MVFKVSSQSRAWPLEGVIQFNSIKTLKICFFAYFIVLCICKTELIPLTLIGSECTCQFNNITSVFSSPSVRIQTGEVGFIRAAVALSEALLPSLLVVVGRHQGELQGRSQGH